MNLGNAALRLAPLQAALRIFVYQAIDDVVPEPLAPGRARGSLADYSRRHLI
jgi:hypothetical protein